METFFFGLLLFALHLVALNVIYVRVKIYFIFGSWRTQIFQTAQRSLAITATHLIIKLILNVNG